MNKEESNLIKGFIILIVVTALFIPLSVYLYNISALGNPLCEEMSAQGYYETEWDTAGHESCRLGYSTWTGTKTNETCMEERFKIDEDNLSNYGVHCVWGSPGYWAFVGSVALIFMLSMPLIVLIQNMYIYYKRKFSTDRKKQRQPTVERAAAAASKMKRIKKVFKNQKI